MDDGRQSQKELIRETLQELLGGSPALKAMMAGSPPSQAGAGHQRESRLVVSIHKKLKK